MGNAVDRLRQRIAVRARAARPASEPEPGPRSRSAPGRGKSSICDSSLRVPHVDWWPRACRNNAPGRAALGIHAHIRWRPGVTGSFIAKPSRHNYNAWNCRSLLTLTRLPEPPRDGCRSPGRLYVIASSSISGPTPSMGRRLRASWKLQRKQLPCRQKSPKFTRFPVFGGRPTFVPKTAQTNFLTIVSAPFGENTYIAQTRRTGRLPGCRSGFGARQDRRAARSANSCSRPLF